MGVFEKVLQPQTAEATLSPQEAVVGVLLAAGEANSQVTPAELGRIDQAIGSMRLFRNQSPEQLNGLAQKMMGVLASGGLHPLIEQAAARLTPELRATVFALATDLVLADGIADDPERAFIDDLQATLKIDDALAIKVVEVMLLKNAG